MRWRQAIPHHPSHLVPASLSPHPGSRRGCSCLCLPFPASPTCLEDGRVFLPPSHFFHPTPNSPLSFSDFGGTFQKEVKFIAVFK